MKKIIFFSIALAVFAASCKKQSSSQPVPAFDSTLQGKWRWIATYNDGALSSTNPATPQNSGNKEELTFNSDGTWSDVLNNSSIGSGTFTTGHSTELDSVTFHSASSVAVSDYIFYHDTVDFTGRQGIVGGGAKFWVKE